MKDLELFKPSAILVDTHEKTTSLKIAKFFGKNHFHVLRDIRELLAEEPEFSASNFGWLENVNVFANKTEVQPYFEITKDGFVMLAMGYTGAKARKLKLSYLAEFNRMRDYIRNLEYTRITTATAKLEAELKTVKTEVLKHTVRRRHEELMGLVMAGILTVSEYERTFFEYEVTEFGMMLGYSQNKNGTIVSPKAGV